MEIDYAKQIHELEKEIKKSKIPSNTNLIKETFVAWYMLVEGSFFIKDDYLQQILDRNMSLINKCYPDNPELQFLRGWMIEISPWFFNIDYEGIGEKYLKLAYKARPDNILFKWALRGNMNMSKVLLGQMKELVTINYDQYYIDYEPIKEYFKDVVAAS